MADSRLRPEIDLDGITAEEAFAVLGNEIRLDIVRTLWETGAVHEYTDVTDAAGTISFSTLRREVDVEDNGRFNYHLSQLRPHFVRGDDDGYRLSSAGKQIARTVVAVSGAEDLDASTELDHECPLCGGAIRARYEDQWLRIRCSECEGLFGDEAPEGTVYLANYPAAGVNGRDPEEALETGLYRCMLDNSYLMRGVCRECGGRVSATTTVCDSHDPGSEGACDDCGTPFPVWAEKRCESCGFAKRLPVELFVMGLAPVIGFVDDVGIDALAPSFEEVIELLHDRTETTVSRDPFRASVTVDGDDSRLTVAVDSEVDVVDVTERSPE